MLNQTAAMCLALRRLADTGFRPPGDLVLWAVPDEECAGINGARLVLEERPELVRTDYALTEVGAPVRLTARGPAIEILPADLAPHAHACTRCTAVPTIVQGGDKVDTIPRSVTIDVSCRPAVGDDPDDVIEEIRTLLSDLVESTDVEAFGLGASESPLDAPLWDVLADATSKVSGATLAPSMLAAWTDAQWLRRAGVTTYGFGLLSEQLTHGDYWSRFHGVEERIDVESLELSALGWQRVAHQFLRADPS